MCAVWKVPLVFPGLLNLVCKFLSCLIKVDSSLYTILVLLKTLKYGNNIKMKSSLIFVTVLFSSPNFDKLFLFVYVLLYTEH